jgi:hypothetical protein
MSELHISQAFREHQAHPIPTPYELEGGVLFKTGFKFIFPIFYEELLHAPMQGFFCVFWNVEILAP